MNNCVFDDAGVSNVRAADHDGLALEIDSFEVDPRAYENDIAALAGINRLLDPGVIPGHVQHRRMPGARQKGNGQDSNNPSIPCG